MLHSARAGGTLGGDMTSRAAYMRVYRLEGRLARTGSASRLGTSLLALVRLLVRDRLLDMAVRADACVAVRIN